MRAKTARQERLISLTTLAAGAAHELSTPLATGRTLDPIEFVRTIAVARITMPAAMVRLSAGRQEMSDETQALCFLAGANSIFSGDMLLTPGNPDSDEDAKLFASLGLHPTTTDRTAIAAE